MTPVKRNTTRSEILHHIAGVVDRPSKKILLTGEPGIGKSTVLDRAAIDFTAAGFVVLRATPSHAERLTLYSTLWDLISELGHSSMEELPAEYRSFLEVALGQQQPSAEVPSLATSIALESLLVHASSAAPVALLIDDLQWADPESLAAIGRAFRRTTTRPVHLVATSRDNDQSGEGAPLDFDASDVYAIAGLTVEELAHVVQPAWPTTLTRSQVVALHEHTDGNPMWALEIIARGQLGSLGALAVGMVRAPASLAGAVADRLLTLSPDAREVVSIVALLGHPPFELLSSVLGFAGIADDAIDEAEAAGFLSTTTRTVRTRHPLQASAAVSRLTPSRRRELHRFIAQAIDDPVIRAQHLEQSQPEGPDETIAWALTQAAVVTRQRGARLRAAHFAAQAVDRTDPLAAPFQARLLTQAQHLFSAGDLASALDALDRASPYRLDVGQYDVYLALSTSTLHASRGHAATHEFLRARIAEIGDDPIRLAIVRANALEDDRMPVDVRAKVSALSFAVLEGVGAPNAVHRALRGAIRAQIDAGHGLNAELIATSTERQGVQIVVGLDDTGLARTAFLSHLIDDVDASRAALVELVEWAEREGKEGIARTFLMYSALTELVAGDAVTARRFAQQAGLTATSADIPPTVLPILGLLLVTGAEYDALERLLSTWESSEAGSGIYRDLEIPALRGLSALARRDWASAVAHLRGAADRADSLGLVEPGSRFRVDAPLIEALFHLGEVEEARRRLDVLRAFLDEHERPITRIAALRLTSLEYAAGGDLEGALATATESIDAAVAVGRSVDEALGLLQRSRVMVRLRKVTLARRDLEAAHALAGMSGDRDVLARIAFAMESSRRPKSPTQLTAAEQRVLDCLREGHANKEIAARLFVSIRTVESHVASILRKTGQPSRSKLITRG